MKNLIHKSRINDTRFGVMVGFVSILTITPPQFVFAETQSGAIQSKEQFLEVYLPALEAIKSEYRSFRATAAVVFTEDGKRTERAYEFFRNADFEADQIVIDAAKPSGQVLSVSSLGVFDARGSSTGQFGVRNVGERKRALLEAQLAYKALPIFLCSFHSVRDFSELLAHPGTTIQSIEDQVEKDERIVRVMLRLDREWFGRESVSITYEPEHGWRQKSWTEVFLALPHERPATPKAKKIEWTVTCEYGERESEDLVPRRVRSVSWHTPWEGGPRVAGGAWDAKFSSFAAQEIPRAQFLPSKFGIPDTLLKEGGQHTRAVGIFRWLAILGIGLIGAFITWRLLGQRTAR